MLYSVFNNKLKDKKMNGNRYFIYCLRCAHGSPLETGSPYGSQAMVQKAKIV